MRILIVEDKPHHLRTAHKFAEESEHEVIIVSSYDEAEQAFIGVNRRAKEFEMNFDVIMTDLLLPASKTGLGNHNDYGEVPYGLSLALLAMRIGVKAIGVLTDGDHHSHPMIWALDPLGAYDSRPFKVGDVTMLFASNGFMDKAEGSDVWSKDWMKFFLALMQAVGPGE